MATFNQMPYSRNVLYISSIFKEQVMEQAREIIEKDNRIPSYVNHMYNDYDFSKAREGFNEWLEKVMKGEEA